MRESIQNFINTRENGLYLLDLPTGTGKTFQTIQYIYEHYEDKPRIFYITTLNKNIKDAYEESRELFKKNGKLEEFEANVLRIYPNAEMVIEKLLDLNIPKTDKITGFDSYKNLCREISYKRRIEEKDSSLKEIFEKEIREKYEPEFRRDVKAYITDQGANRKERLRFIRENHSWLIDIYPAILTSQRKVLFMTIDKFYLGNDTIVEPTYKFVNNSLLFKGATVFIDEIDATKNTILNRQIEDSLKNNVDVVHLFLNIHHTINHKKFPKEMLGVPKSAKDGLKPKNILIRFKEIFNQAYDEFDMQYSFKLLEKDQERKYIFDDSETVTIAKGQEYEMYIEKSIKENYNRIVKTNGTDFKKLTSFINRLKGTIKFFVIGTYMLSLNYCAFYNEVLRGNGDEMQIDDAALSIIRAFNINDKFIPYLSNVVLSAGSSRFNQVSKIQTEVYDLGFRYYRFSDSISNSLATQISMYDLNDTPENLMLNMCNKAHIIGLSATSTIETVIGNYDIKYLRRNLGENYYVPSIEENSRIEKLIASRFKSNKSNIRVELQSSTDDKAENINEIFKDAIHRAELLTIVSSGVNVDDFQIRRFLKIAKALKCFIQSGLKSCLVLCNKNLKNENHLYSEYNFKRIVSNLCKELNVENDYQLRSLVTKNFDEAKSSYLNDAKDNKKIILFSSYQTTGAGQNLQYELETEEGIKEEDINAIYVEKPTHLLVFNRNLDDTNSADLIKLIFQIEELSSNGEITNKDKNIIIKEAFKKMTNPDYILKHQNPYECNSVKNYGVSIIIQAIGRICRTNNKIKDTLIMVDKDIMDSYNLTIFESKRLNKEFRMIIDKAKELKLGAPSTFEYITELQRAANNNRRIYSQINDLLRYQRWTEANIELWKSLREQVLRYPTNPGVFGEEGRFQNCYLYQPDYKIDYYFYNQENDYGTVELGYKENGFSSKVSSAGCNLDSLMQIPFIKDAFIKNGYATTFKKNNYIMLPIIFNNIYKGALGEAVGKIYFENLLGVELEEITESDKFEKFDFKMGDIYIDFKNWNNSGEKLVIENTIKKAKDVNAEKVLVINVLGDADGHVSHEENVIVVPSIIDMNSHKIVESSFKKLIKIVERSQKC